ncbi:hypothetical protein D5086_007698 [Populus alba]|uniref:Uncharacterized protein n=1 Tax=Populus alba TaxID=43335 RepID=A0ACC4CEW9_POPAL
MLNHKKAIGMEVKKKQKNSSLQGDAKKFVSFGTKSLATNGFHSHGKARENRVACDCWRSWSENRVKDQLISLEVLYILAMHLASLIAKER